VPIHEYANESGPTPCCSRIKLPCPSKYVLNVMVDPSPSTCPARAVNVNEVAVKAVTWT
jgi:hypothetical protein